MATIQQKRNPVLIELFSIALSNQHNTSSTYGIGQVPDDISFRHTSNAVNTTNFFIRKQKI